MARPTHSAKHFSLKIKTRIFQDYQIHSINPFDVRELNSINSHPHLINRSVLLAVHSSFSFFNLYGEQIRSMAPVAVGDSIPDGTLSYFDDQDQLQNVSIHSLAAGKKVILFAVPGAFTPTCRSNLFFRLKLSFLVFGIWWFLYTILGLIEVLMSQLGYFLVCVGFSVWSMYQALLRKQMSWNQKAWTSYCA